MVSGMLGIDDMMRQPSFGGERAQGIRQFF